MTNIKSSVIFSIVLGVFILAVFTENMNSILATIIGWLGIFMLTLFRKSMTRVQFISLFSLPIACTDAMYFSYVKYIMPNTSVQILSIWEDGFWFTLGALICNICLYLFFCLFIRHFKIKERIGCVR